MKCKQAKLDLALLVGNDLEPEAERVVQRHLAECPQCRLHWQRLRSMGGVLREVADGGRDFPSPNLWQQVQSRLPANRAVLQRSGAEGWFPVAALAAACCVVLVFSSGTPVFELSPLDSVRTADAPARRPVSATFVDFGSSIPVTPEGWGTIESGQDHALQDQRWDEPRNDVWSVHRPLSEHGSRSF